MNWSVPSSPRSFRHGGAGGTDGWIDPDTGVVAVYIPEYVVGRWWEQLLHNQTALRLKGRLLFTPGVMVISVPYQLRSSIASRGERPTPRSARRPWTGSGPMPMPASVTP